jgi:DNA-binding NarL/FixJ family response regulator
VLTRHASAASSTSLTPREREVLALVGAGLSNKIIALRLGISEATVKAHLTNVYQRLGVTDRALQIRRANMRELTDGYTGASRFHS